MKEWSDQGQSVYASGATFCASKVCHDDTIEDGRRGESRGGVDRREQDVSLPVKDRGGGVKTRVGRLNADDLALKRRSARRRRIIVGHVAKNFADAEQWDLEFWQNQTSQMRLSALVAIRNDILAIRGKDKTFNWDN